MFRAILVAALLSAVMAFAPAGPRRASMASLKMADEMVGASSEAWILNGDKASGTKAYDPLDMLKLHERNKDFFPHPKWLRESELKHGRAAMLASVGAFTGQYGLVIPGYTAVADPVENLNQFVVNYPLGFAQIILAIAIIEGASDPSQFWWGKGSRAAGDLGFDPLGFSGKGKSDAAKRDLQLKELKVGRAGGRMGEGDGATLPRCQAAHAPSISSSLPTLPSLSTFLLTLPPTLLPLPRQNGRLAMIAMAAYTSEHWIPGAVPFMPGKF